jgi:hypothetical protein
MPRGIAIGVVVFCANSSRSRKCGPLSRGDVEAGVVEPDEGKLNEAKRGDEDIRGDIEVDAEEGGAGGWLAWGVWWTRSFSDDEFTDFDLKYQNIGGS